MLVSDNSNRQKHTELNIEIHSALNPVLNSAEQQMIRQRLSELLNDLSIEVETRIQFIQADNDMLRHKGCFDIKINGIQARVRMQRPFAIMQQDRAEWIAEVFFENRCLLVTDDFVKYVYHTLLADASWKQVLPLEQFSVMLRRCSQYGLNIDKAIRVAEQYSGYADNIEDNDYAIDAILAVELPRKVTVHISRALYDYIFAPPEPSNKGSESIEEMKALMRDGLFYELGIRFPTVNFEYSEQLEEYQFRILLHQLRGPVHACIARNEVLVNDTVDRLTLLKIKGREAINPANGNQCAIIEEAFANIAEQAGLTTWDASAYVILTLSAELRHHAMEYLSVTQVETMLRYLDQAFPLPIFNIYERYSIRTLSDVLRYLVREGVSVRDLRTILEAMLEVQDVTKENFVENILLPKLHTQICPPIGFDQVLSPRHLSEAARIALQAQITHATTRGGNTVVVYLLSQAMENRIIRANGYPLDDQEIIALFSSINQELSACPSIQSTPPILVTAPARPVLRDLLEFEFPNLKVLSYQELDPSVNIQPIARIDWNI
jgi:flagellar biosynthesis component FlhA